MRWAVSVLFGLLFVTALGGCASERMVDLANAPAAVTTRSADAATVVFLRPTMLGGAVQSSVFDVTEGETQLVGIVSAGRKIAYASKPGKRRFMVVGESADFMDADLTPARIYYARVEPRFGVWKARFSLSPVLANDSAIDTQLASCTWVENTEASRVWARENATSINEKRTAYLASWEKEADKPVLPANAGR